MVDRTRPKARTEAPGRNVAARRSLADLGAGLDFPATVAVAAPEDVEVLRALDEARKRYGVEVILCGDRDRIASAANEAGYDMGVDRVVAVPTDVAAAKTAVVEVREGRADFVMKGLLPTATLLRAVVDKENGLVEPGRLLSHVAVFDYPAGGRMLFLTDAAMNVAPDLEAKVQILANAVLVCHALGLAEPKVAALAAVETVNPKMPATTEAACLTVMSRRGQLPRCVVDGPMALDNAVSPGAAQLKGLTGEVAGEVDILLVPSLEVGNVLYKAMAYFGGYAHAGVVVGGKVPVILTSRADSHETKLASVALARAICRPGGAALAAP